MADWSHRLVRDLNGTLHFAIVRFRPGEHRSSGLMEIRNEGTDREEMRNLAKELLAACDRAIVEPGGHLATDLIMLDDDAEVA
jgi:hypothetical protein